MMIDAGAMLDDGMVYWDVRPSAKFPTVEVRVADVPATVAETVLLATLTRAAVMTALAEHDRGLPAPRIDDHVLRAAVLEGGPRRSRRAGHRRGRQLRDARRPPACWASG